MQYTSTPYCCQRFLDPDGRLVSQLPAHLKEPAWLLNSYRHMVLIRHFNQRMVDLQRTGFIGTYPSCLGEEAIGTAIGLTLHKDDVFAPYYRDLAAQTLRGVSFKQQMQYWGGDEWGNHFEGTASADLPNCVPIATQVTHAAGIASAFKIRQEKRCALTTCGDGATSRGDFYEAINLAGAWHLPLVVVVNNNHWAISLPRHQQTAAPTLAHKAVAAGIESFQVDGNDIIALYDGIQYAVKKARAGKGATLIEAITYRLADHTTADDASRYRPTEEVNTAWNNEPIKRLRIYLTQQAWWSEQQEQQLIQQVNEKIQDAVNQFKATEAQPVDDLFDYLFADLPLPLAAQKSLARAKYNTQMKGT